jgi:cyanophycinase
MENPDLKCIGIDESTAIIVSGKMVKVVGSSQVIVFDSQGIKAKLNGEKLGQSDMKLSIYLAGDVFNLK